MIDFVIYFVAELRKLRSSCEGSRVTKYDKIMILFSLWVNGNLGTTLPVQFLRGLGRGHARLPMSIGVFGKTV